ncbi:hypothetical protein KSZ_65460 [Dictyobacter formicarum]|uniref:Uncharacterized protein n=1 Tax=Dictyobacter formicarum TaxID=2778368 RepID=A0ABQ3VQW5_9CHLR|nr:hypothetical protein KSZ_65460 [Dictyobacter formicarum]
MGNQQVCRTTVYRGERLPLIPIDDPRLPIEDVCQRKVDGIAAITEGDYVVGIVLHLL